MNNRTKQNLIVTIVGVCLFAALTNFSTVLSAASSLLQIVLPIIVGGIVALFLSVPVNGMRKILNRRMRHWEKKPSDEMIRQISFVIVFLMVIFVVALVFMLLIPELSKSGKTAYAMLQKRIPEWTAYLQAKGFSSKYLEETLGMMDFSNIFGDSSGTMSILLSSAASTVGSLISVISTAGFGLIIGIYLILGSERTSRHVNKLVYGFLPTKWADQIYRVSRLFKKSFTSFLTGQCLEAVILGILMFIAFSLFRLPYASLVGVVTAFCAIIPYVGAFLSLLISIVLTLLIDPMLAIRAAIVYLVVQFCENQFLYPRVVGGSVGMPPLYTLIAALLGGKLFGVAGILFFIPIMATVIELVKEEANRRLELKKTREIE